jgi:O-antigen/teichoic acid export membrane protein
VIFLITQGDDIFVGKILGVTALGFYQMAYLISNLCATEITHVISSVTFPAYSKMQNDLERTKQACLRVVRLTCAISFPLAAGILVLAPELTQVILTEKWMPIVPALQVMCIFGAMRAIAATFGPVYRAIGRPDVALKINISHFLCLALIIFPLTIMWGLTGTAIAITLSMLFALCLTSRKIVSLLNVNFIKFYIPILSAFLPTIAMVILLVVLKRYVIEKVCYSSMVFFLLIGALFIMIFSYGTNKIIGDKLGNLPETFHTLKKYT